MAIFVLTGTPGTGKSSVANYFAKKGFIIIDLNKLVNERHLWHGKEKGSKVVDIYSLKKETAKEISRIKKILKSETLQKSKTNKQNIIVEGHLACEFQLPADAVIILRTRPDMLIKRLKGRGYPRHKISENVQVEMVDYCTSKSEENYNCPIYEVDSSGSLRATISKLNKIMQGYPKKAKKIKKKSINWSRYAFNNKVAKYLFE
ncbi:MAG: AAA family ATPase [Candidatus Micrarchaeia archaeon]